MPRKKQPVRPQLGRPKIYTELSMPTTIRMERALLVRLDKQCQKRGLLRSQGVAEAIEKWLET